MCLCECAITASCVCKIGHCVSTCLLVITLAISFPCSVTCNTSSSSRGAQTMGPNEYSVVVGGLSPFTRYNCCSTAQYSNSREDSTACSTVITREGGEDALLSDDNVVIMLMCVSCSAWTSYESPVHCEHSSVHRGGAVLGSPSCRREKWYEGGMNNSWRCPLSLVHSCLYNS